MANNLNDMLIYLKRKRRQSESEYNNSDGSPINEAKRKCNNELDINDEQQPPPGTKITSAIDNDNDNIKSDGKKVKTKSSANMQKAIELFKSGTKLKDAAETYQVPQTSLKRQLEILGLYRPSIKKRNEFKAPRKEKEELVKKAMEFYIANEKISQKEAATKYNLCESTVKKHLRKENLSRSKGKRSNAKVAAVKKTTATADSLSDVSNDNDKIITITTINNVVEVTASTSSSGDEKEVTNNNIEVIDGSGIIHNSNDNETTTMISIANIEDNDIESEALHPDDMLPSEESFANI